MAKAVVRFSRNFATRLSIRRKPGRGGLLSMVKKKIAAVVLLVLLPLATLSAASGLTSGFRGIVTRLFTRNRILQPDSESAFVESARKGDLAAVKKSLASGMNPNTRDPRDEESATVLMVAAMAGKANVVRTLLDSGADVGGRSVDGRTALTWAAWIGSNSIANDLMAHNADVNAADSWGATPLMFALARSHKDTATIL